MGNYNSPTPGGWGTTNTGMIIGLIAAAAYGYWRWGEEGVLLGLGGAFAGHMAETAFIAGNAGRASLLLALVPISILGALAYAVATWFR